MIKLIDENEELKHSLPFTDIKRTRELNGEDSLDFETTEKIEEGKRIVFKDEQGIWNEYIIQEVEILHDGEDITYLAYCESSINELFGHFILDMKPRNAKASAILTNILKGTRFKVGLVEDTDVKSFNIYHTNVKAAIWKILDTYGLDISVEIKVSIGEKSRITDRIINLSKHLGDFEGKRYTYKKDLRSIKKTIDYTNIATLLYGYGKGEEVVGDDGKPTGGYGRKINFAEYNKGKQYITNEKARKLYGVGKNRLHIEGVYENSECEDKKELLELTRKELEKRSKPKISYELSVEDLSKYEGYKFESVDLGDDVLVIDDEIKTAVYTRVVKIVDSPFSNNDTEITLGNYVKDISEEFIEYEKLRNTIENRNQELGEEIKKLAQATDKGFLKSVVDRLNGELNATGGYVYFKQGEGILILNAPIDGNPSQAINLKGGMISIANKKKANGQWDWTTFGTGNGFTASVIVAGILRGGKVRWNLEDGTFIIGNDPTDYSMYWDGATLHLRNVDIDLENNRTIQDLKDKQNLTDEEIEKQKQEIIKANQSLESAKADIDQANLDIESTLEKLKQAREDFDRDIGAVSATVDQNKEDWEYRNKIVDEKLLDLNSSFKITDEKIDASVSSIKETLEERIKVTKSDLEKYADDKDDLIAAQIDNKDKELRTYITKNYSTSTQTDEKISQEVGSLKTLVNADIGDLSKEITEAKSKIEQTNNSITAKVSEVEVDMSNVQKNIRSLSTDVKLTQYGLESKVSENEIISKINQSPEAVKIQARNIDLTGNVSVRGDFTTLNNYGKPGIHIADNKVTWSDDRWTGKRFGEINITTNTDDASQFSLNMGHYPTGQMIFTYYDNDSERWIRYMSFDRWNYTRDGGKNHPIIMDEGVLMDKGVYMNQDVYMKKGKLYLGDFIFETNYKGELKIHHKDRNAGIKVDKYALYAYYASGGDVDKEIAKF